MADANEPPDAAPVSSQSSGVGTSDPSPPMASNGLSLANLAHGLKLAALLLFLLPWVTVSCAEHTLVSLSGMDLATGSVSVVNPMTGEKSSPAGSEGADIPVLIAALLIVATLVVGFALRRPLARTISAAGLAVAALLISYSVLVRLPDRARQGATADSAQGISEAQIAELIRVEVASGFWLTLFALIGAIAATLLARGPAPPDRP